MKKNYALLLLLLCISTALQAQFASGNGTSANPWKISTPQHLNNLLTNQNNCNQGGKYFELTTNISMGAYINSNYGADGWIPTAASFKFHGNLNGKGYAISGVWKNDTNTYVGGLFGTLETGGSIKNLKVEIGNKGIAGRYFAGGIVGINRGTISSCFVTGGEVYSKDIAIGIGAIVGENGGTITNCHSDNPVRGKNHVFYPTSIPPGIGGFVGLNNGEIKFSYSLSSVTSWYGGGAFIGLNKSGTVHNCFFNNELTGQLPSIGKDLNNQSANIQGKTMIQLKMQANYPLWNFSSIWKIIDECSLPLLIWEANPPHCSVCFEEGDGSYNNPFQINNAEKLECLRSYSGIKGEGKYFILTADIYLKDYIIQNYSTSGWPPIDDFRGTLDGRDYEIDGLYTNGKTVGGLFASLSGQGQIKNLGLTNYEIENCNTAGALVANNGGRITRCYTAGYIFGGDNKIGGMVGHNTNTGFIENCRSYVAIAEANNYAGGLVGWNDGIIKECYVHGCVTGNYAIGGIIGVHNEGYMELCHSYVAMAGNIKIGGIVGENYSYMIHCYSHGFGLSESYLGGITGYHNHGNIINSYSAFIPLASNNNSNISTFGNFVGYIQDYICIESSYFDYSINCLQLNPTGIGSNSNGVSVCAYPSAHNTYEMMYQQTYGYYWDWTNIWGIRNGLTYPFFVKDEHPYYNSWRQYSSVEEYFNMTSKVDIDSYFPWFLLGLDRYTDWNSIIWTGRFLNLCNMGYFGTSASFNNSNENINTLFIKNFISKTSDNIKIYPNPTSGILTIETENNGLKIQIYDIRGVLILETNKNIIDLSSKANGVYFVHVNGKVFKVIKQ